jgi:hypothetical protein
MGRPQGSRNKATIALQALLDEEGEQITRKAIEMAKAGGNTASECKPVPGNPLLNGEPGTDVRAPLGAILKPLISLLESAV